MLQIDDRIRIVLRHVVALETKPIGVDFKYRVVLAGGVAYAFNDDDIAEQIENRVNQLK